MKLPTYPEQHYAMHLVASSLVELFPKLQLLNLAVLPDRFVIDFSFSRPLDVDEMRMVKDRFFDKLRRKEKGAIREMVSKNACDLLKHYKQIFLTELVDRDEQFTEMFCLDSYNAPVMGELNQESSNVKEIKLSVFDLGEKKWAKRKVHHYSLDGFSFYSHKDKKAQTEDVHTHLEAGKELFFVSEEELYFTPKGEKKFGEMVDEASTFFGDKVFLDGEPEDFFEVLKVSDFFIEKCFEQEDLSEFYGIKGSAIQRSIICFSFSNSDLKDNMSKFCAKFDLEGEFIDNEYIIYDYKGIPWVCGEFEDQNDYLILEINLQRLLALSLERK